MADYKKIDLQIGTEEQFEEKKLSLPVGTLVGITDPIHESELDTDLQTKINDVSNKLTAPTTPTEESAVTLLSDGTVGTKPLNSITGKTEVAVQGAAPTGTEVLWINPNGTSSGGGSGSVGGKLYKHTVKLWHNHDDMYTDYLEYVEYRSNDTPIADYSIINEKYCYIKFTNADTGDVTVGFVQASLAYDTNIGLTGVAGSSGGTVTNIYGMYSFESIHDYVTEM